MWRHGGPCVAMRHHSDPSPFFFVPSQGAAVPEQVHAGFQQPAATLQGSKQSQILKIKLYKCTRNYVESKGNMSSNALTS